jgi:hypothetical protein
MKKVLFLGLLCVMFLASAGSAKEAVKAPIISLEETEIISGLEKEWVLNLNRAALAIDKKDFFLANTYIYNSVEAVEEIKDLLRDKPVNIGQIDSMKNLSLAYENLSELIMLADNPDSLGANENEISALVSDTRARLKDAEEKFARVKSLQAICRTFGKKLDKTVEEIKKHGLL